MDRRKTLGTLTAAFTCPRGLNIPRGNASPVENKIKLLHPWLQELGWSYARP